MRTPLVGAAPGYRGTVSIRAPAVFTADSNPAPKAFVAETLATTRFPYTREVKAPSMSLDKGISQ